MSVISVNREYLLYFHISFNYPFILMLGFSLIEVMISLLLSMLLMLGITEFYQQHKHDFVMIHALAKLQDHARIASHFLIDKITVIKDRGSIQIYPAASTIINELPATMRKRIIPHSDILRIKNSNNNVLIYVAHTVRRNHRNEIINALYETDLNQHTAELVTGIENMKLKLSYCNYTLENKNDVCLVRISLLLASIEAIRRQPQTIKYNNKTLTKIDGRYYQSWSIAIATH